MRQHAAMALALLTAAACSRSTPPSQAEAPTPAADPTPTAEHSAPAPPVATAAPAPAPAAEPDRVLVVVNGAKVTSRQVAAVTGMLASLAGAASAGVPATVQQELEKRALDRVVARTLLQQHAREKGFSAPPEEVEEAFAGLASALPPGATERDMEQLVGADAATLRSELAGDIIVRKLVDSMELSLGPDEAALAAYYSENKAAWATPEEASASHVLVAVGQDAPPDQIEAARAKAAGLVARARAGDALAFAALADAESDDPSAKENHGDMGFFERGRMVPEFSEAAFRLATGDVSEPVRTRFGFHVIRGQGVRPAGFKPFDEVRDLVARRYVRAAVAKELMALAKGLRDKAKIETPGEPGEDPAVEAPQPPGTRSTP